VAEFRKQLHGWTRECRIVVVRELQREKLSLGRRLFDVPGYTFRLFATSLPLAPEEIWRDYNQRADMEKRIAELKYDLAADDFCLKEFFATEATFRAILLLFNLLSEFQRVSGMQGYRNRPQCAPNFFLRCISEELEKTLLHCLLLGRIGDPQSLI
jgi:hypothetical protein